MEDENNFEIGNAVKIAGVICSDLTESHQVEGEKFYECIVDVKRLSESSDLIPVTISEKLMFGQTFKKGDFVEVLGEFRSYNRIFGEKSKLILHVFAKEMSLSQQKEYLNEIKLTGFLCKDPIYRKTPFNREICDILLAVNRPNYHKSDYVPCILWGRNARFIAGQNIGCKLEVIGRIQSREYSKTREDGAIENKTAYEVSCQRISVLSNISNFGQLSSKDDEVVGN